LLCFFIAGGIGRAQMPPFFNVRDYGAAGDGTNIDSPAINAAIVAAGAAGGGTVTFPPGNYISLSIHLTNNVTLYLSNNAVVLAAATNGFDPAEANAYSQYQDYGHSHFHDSLIWGENLTNIGFAGSGTISGGGNLVSGNPGTGQADKAITLVMCSDVTITGIMITAAGHFAILADACTNLVVSGAQILNAYANQHRDAFNLIDSSDAVVSNCVIQGSDDAMVLKSDYALGRKIGGHDIHISNCQILSTENNATQFGSETVGDFSDVTWSNLQLTAAGKAGIGITSQDGSVIDGVTYDHITMSNCACPIFLKLDYRTTDTPAPSVGRIRNISINNVTAVHSAFYNRTNTSTINGYFNTNDLTMTPIENITFNNVNVSNIGKNPATAVTNDPVENQDWQPQNFGRWPSYGWYLRYADNVSFSNCQVHFDNNDDRPAVVADTVSNVLFADFAADVGQNNTNYDLSFLDALDCDTTNAIATTNAPVPGADLRISRGSHTNTPPPVIAFEAENLPYITNGAPAVLQNDADTSGGHWLALEATGPNQWIQYTLTNIPAGTYNLQMSYKAHPDRGVLSFELDGVLWPDTLDQYANPPAYPVRDWGLVTFTNAGNHNILLTCVGKNPAATGYWLSVDRFILSPVNPPVIGAITLSGSNVALSGAGGVSGAYYYVLASTNLSLPLSQWTSIATNAFDSDGSFNFTNVADLGGWQRFFLLKLESR